ncbi:hypothetical protein KQX54_004947 [Cotesia glomerata]|uniref:Uncharacterized protein n=1 Tax=Cotesia glomerata TaxID=32391 RepID=A0AAV7IPS7_COTGL|nr:hypothetical protein KQX54_004947 [Cotesia glomerata]
MDIQKTQMHLNMLCTKESMDYTFTLSVRRVGSLGFWADTVESSIYKRVVSKERSRPEQSIQSSYSISSDVHWVMIVRVDGVYCCYVAALTSNNYRFCSNSDSSMSSNKSSICPLVLCTVYIKDICQEQEQPEYAVRTCRGQEGYRILFDVCIMLLAVLLPGCQSTGHLITWYLRDANTPL